MLRPAIRDLHSNDGIVVFICPSFVMWRRCPRRRVYAPWQYSADVCTILPLLALHCIALDCSYRTALIGKWGLGNFGTSGYPLYAQSPFLEPVLPCCACRVLRAVLVAWLCDTQASKGPAWQSHPSLPGDAVACLPVLRMLTSAVCTHAVVSVCWCDVVTL